VTSEEFLRAVFDALTALDVPFMVSGSLASNFYGVPRSTQDADLVVELARLPLAAFAAHLGEPFQPDTQLAFETVTGSRRLVVRAVHSPFEVELFDLTEDPHDRERFARRREVELFGRRVAVPTAEDVVVNKLRWWKLAGRRKDFEDARNTLAVQTALDMPYLKRWCRELDLLNELEAANRR
jgi:hypothetical protein